MRFVAFSDLHGELPAIDPSKADAVILAGDLCADVGYLGQYQWLETKLIPHLKDVGLPGIAIFGNHDFVGQKMVGADFVGLFGRAGYTYLDGGETEFNGITVHGSPYVTGLPNWAFNVTESRYRDYLQYVDPVDLLVTHGPPYGILDAVAPGLHVGSQSLAFAVERIRPKVHVFGHIHESFGEKAIEHIDKSVTRCYNVAQYGGIDRFVPISRPVYFEL